MEESIERYLLAFEAKSLSEAACGARIEKLAVTAANLRQRRAELAAELEDEPEVGDVEIDHAAIKATLAELIEAGDRPTAKALLRTLVHEVRVESRDSIWPTFRVPTAAPAAWDRIGVRSASATR